MAKDQALAAGLCLAVCLSALAWSTHFVAEYTLPKLFALQLGVLIAAAAACLRSPGPGRTPLDLPVALNLAAVVLAAAASQDWRTSVIGRYNSYSQGLWAWGLYSALCLAGARLDRSSAKRVCGILLGAACVVAAYGVAQVLGFEPFLRAALPSGNRAVSSLGSPVDLGAFLAAMLPLAAGWFICASRPGGALAFAIIAGGLIATGSRGAWLGASIGTAACVLLAGRAAGFGVVRAGMRRVPPWVWICLALTLFGAAWAVRNRLAARGGQGTDSQRVEVWRTALKIFREHPVLGTGPDTFEQAFRRARTEEYVRRMKNSTGFQAYAHNDLLQALSTTGIVGAGAYLYLLMMVALAGRAACRSADARLAAGVSGGLLAVFVNMEVNPISLEVMALAALLCGVIAALGSSEAAPRSSRVAERIAAVSAACFSAAGLLLAARLLAADRESKSAQMEFAAGRRAAGMDHARAAVSLAPCTTAYRVQQMNAMGDLINAEKGVPGRLALLAEALASGQEAVRCHPSEVNGHYALGVAAWMHVQLGLERQLETAERELDAALERDPLFLPLIEQRAAVAGKRGGPQAAQWSGRLARARALN